jgi:hypothetical protein
LARATVKRLIRGDRRHKAKLAGLGWVRWDEGKGRSGTRYRLTDEGAKVANILAKGLSVGKATLRALATDYLRKQRRPLPPDALDAFVTGYIEKGLAALQDRRVVAILLALIPTAKNVTKNVTTSFISMPSNDGFKNRCSHQAVPSSKLALAERLYRDYGVRWWVAEDLAARYSPLAIKAAIALRERRNGAIYNPAGFIVYLLRDGYAQRLAEAWRRARPRPRPTRKPPDEPDWDAIVAALREALAPYGIRVDDAGRAVLPNYLLPLPPDPDEAVALLWRHGFLRDGNGQDADQDPADAPDQAPTDADALTDDAPTVADPTEALRAADDADDGDDEDDDGEPLPPPTCDLCGRSQGEPHPALNKGQVNNLMALSRLSDAFKHRFGLPEFGVICRGCYMTLCRTLILGGQPDPADAPDQAPTVADPTEALRAADDADDGDDEDDDGEPLPPPSCDLCGRKEGEPHPALASWQRNDFLCLSELSDDFKQRFGLPKAGLLCRGCYVTLCRTLCPADQDQNTEATETDQAPKDNDDAIADAKPDSHQPDRSDGQNDPSDDSENCPNPLVKVFLLPDSAAEAFQPVVRDLMTAFKTKDATEIVKDGVTYRLKDFRPLEGGLAFALIEVDATTLPPETQALIDELCRLYKRDGTVAIERGCLRVEIAEVIRLAEGKALYRFSVTKLDKGRKQR